MDADNVGPPPDYLKPELTIDGKPKVVHWQVPKERKKLDCPSIIKPPEIRIP